VSDEAPDGDGSDAIALVKRAMQAGADGDLDAVLGLYHPQVAISPTGTFAPPGTSYHGFAGVRNLLNNLGQRFPSLHYDPVEFAAVDGRVLVHMSVTPRRERPAETTRLTWLYTLSQGRIRRAEGFETESAAMAALKRPLPITVARQFCDAVCRRDLDAMLALCDRDVQLFPTRRLAPAGTSYRGRPGLVTAMQSVLARFEKLKLVPEFHEFGDRVLVVAAVTTADGPQGKQPPVAVMLTVLEGAIRFAEELADPATYAPTDLAERLAAHDGSGALLTPREREIFRLLALGLSGPEIAAELFLSPATVRTHVQNGVSRLGARTRVQAIAIAISQGEIEL
jgi:DNA-binding CsgD family transcriptional regulator/ketosteroid isomerase-like protein